MSAPDDDRPENVDDEELAELADELSGVLRELRDELAATREAREAGEAEIVEPEPSSGGGGVPDIPFDLPSATDVLAFTDEKLIPAAITVLEVNIRALELLQKGIRWARPDKAGENAERVRSHAESVSRSTLQRLDTVLADLQDAASRGALPDDAAASDVITEARSLRDEIDAALEQRADAREADEPDDAAESPEEDAEDGDQDDTRSDPFGLDDQPEVDVDVESELASIKAELGKDDDDDDGTTGDDDGAGEDGADEGAGEDGADDESTDEAADDGATDEGAAEGRADETHDENGNGDDGHSTPPQDGQDGAGPTAEDGPDAREGPATDAGDSSTSQAEGDDGNGPGADGWTVGDDDGGDGSEREDGDDEDA